MSMTNPIGTPRGTDAVVGERVHQLMWRNHESQTSFAPRLGIGQAALSMKLRGRRGWSTDEVLTVARHFGVSVDYLFGNDDGVGTAGIEPTTSTV